jgi:hypothetical protein
MRAQIADDRAQRPGDEHAYPIAELTGSSAIGLERELTRRRILSRPRPEAPRIASHDTAEVADPSCNRNAPLQKANLTQTTKSANAFLMSRIV